jgi:hypothetical protein
MSDQESFRYQLEDFKPDHFILDVSGCFTYVSPDRARKWNQSPCDLLGSHYVDHFDGKYFELFHRSFINAIGGSSSSFRWQAPHAFEIVSVIPEFRDRPSVQMIVVMSSTVPPNDLADLQKAGVVIHS